MLRASSQTNGLKMKHYPSFDGCIDTNSHNNERHHSVVLVALQMLFHGPTNEPRAVIV